MVECNLHQNPIRFRAFKCFCPQIKSTDSSLHADNTCFLKFARQKGDVNVEVTLFAWWFDSYNKQTINMQDILGHWMLAAVFKNVSLYCAI